MISLGVYNGMSFKQNDRSKEFVEKVKSLVESAEEPTFKAIADKLKWNSNALHLVIKGQRNVPADVYKKYTEIYKIGVSGETSNNVDFQDKYIALLEKRNHELEEARKTLLEKVSSIEQTLIQMRTDMGVMAALQKGYQEYWAEYYPPKNSKPDEALKRIHSKALSSLKKIQQEGIRL